MRRFLLDENMKVFRVRIFNVIGDTVYDSSTVAPNAIVASNAMHESYVNFATKAYNMSKKTIMVGVAKIICEENK